MASLTVATTEKFQPNPTMKSQLIFSFIPHIFPFKDKYIYTTVFVRSIYEKAKGTTHKIRKDILSRQEDNLIFYLT